MLHASAANFLPHNRCECNLGDTSALLDRHPFNVEPPPDVLMSRGFITPVSLHYVRNHGPVPKLAWETHRLNIGNSDLVAPASKPCCITALLDPASAVLCRGDASQCKQQQQQQP